MRPDIAPADGELTTLALIALIAWAVYAISRYRNRSQP